MFEFTETIETLWKTTLEFMKLHPEHVAKDNSMGFLSDDNGGDYNRQYRSRIPLELTDLINPSLCFESDCRKPLCRCPFASPRSRSLEPADSRPSVSL
jgi:hypothetical protein